MVLPELFTTGYAGLRGIHRHAEDAKRGTSAAFFASLARRLGLYITYGFPEEHPSGEVSDSANLVGPRGLFLTYRKRQLVWTTGEPGVFVPGGEVPVVLAGGARIALVICWDLGSPEAVREAALKGADLILAPAGWRSSFGSTLPARAGTLARNHFSRRPRTLRLPFRPAGDYNNPLGECEERSGTVAGSVDGSAVERAFPPLPLEEWEDSKRTTPTY